MDRVQSVQRHAIQAYAADPLFDEGYLTLNTIHSAIFRPRVKSSELYNQLADSQIDQNLAEQAEQSSLVQSLSQQLHERFPIRNRASVVTVSGPVLESR